jgi:hypothetical protein
MRKELTGPETPGKSRTMQYRFLEVDEVIKEGDEISCSTQAFEQDPFFWGPLTASIGSRIWPDDEGYFRRPISQNNKE